MAKTDVRAKSKKAQANNKNTGGSKKTARRILVDDLVVGHRIVTSWQSSGGNAKQHSNMTVDEVMDVLRGNESEESARYVAASTQVRAISLCEGQWRTHKHINKSDCYDIRQHVWIVKE